jgi:TolA-binding protein
MAKMDKYTAPREGKIMMQQAADVVDDMPSAEERFQGVQSFYDSNPWIPKVLLGVAAIGLALFAYTRFYKGPQTEKADSSMFRAQMYYSMDSLNWALNGDGNNLGFLKIIDKYGSTKAGNLAQYYAGICYLKKGEFAKAEKHLREFDGMGTMVGNVASGSLGDALMEQNKVEDAIKSYITAANDKDNMLLSPLYLERAAMAYEMKGNNAEAIKLYKEIKDKFPMSMQARNLDKNLARLGDYSL